MITRRIADGLRRQDWTTVLVEFVIVVAGIFVGLQANDWNEARLDREQERENLERLLTEAENAVTYIVGEIENGSSRIASQRELLEFLFSDDPLPANTVSLEWGFLSLNFFPALAPSRATYDELTATGGLRVIRSDEVRNAIARYHAAFDFFDKQLAYFRDFSLVESNDPYQAGRDYFRAEYEPVDDVGRRFIFDWEAMRADTYLKTIIVGKLRNQTVMNLNREGLLEQARIMCDELAAAVGRQCRSGGQRATPQPE